VTDNQILASVLFISLGGGACALLLNLKAHSDDTTPIQNMSDLLGHSLFRLAAFIMGAAVGTEFALRAFFKVPFSKRNRGCYFCEWLAAAQ
jgi:hypothetical protein